MMCSPYLTGSLAIMLVIVAFNYWTVAAENSELSKKLQDMQQQLKSGTSHIKNLEEEIAQVRNLENKCKKNTKELREEAETKLKDMETVQKQRDKFKVERDKLDLQLKDTRNEEDQEEKRLLEDTKMKENTIDSLRDEIESLKLNISTIQLNVTSCQAELASERADRLIQPPEGAGLGMPPRHLPSKLGPGQLPDLSPDAVSVVRKETNGSPGLKLDEAAGYEEAGLRDNIIPRGSSSRRPVSVASYVSSSSQKSNDIFESPGVVPAPKVVVNEAGVMPLPGNLDKAEDDSNIVQEEDPAEDDQNPDGLIDERVVLDKQNYLVDKNGADDNEDEETEDVDSDVMKEDAEEGLDTISNEGNEAEEKLENLKENLDKDDDTLGESE